MKLGWLRLLRKNEKDYSSFGLPRQVLAREGDNHKAVILFFNTLEAVVSD